MKKSLPIRPAQGFTLIELLIVITIIGILAMFSYPSYQQFVLRTRLENVRSDMLANAQALEREYMKNHTFAGATAAMLKQNEYFLITFVGTPAAETYTLQAVPNAKNRSETRVMRLNHNNIITLCTNSRATDCTQY